MQRTYFGGVEPDQIERVEIERRVRTVKNRPCSKLSRREAWDYNARELRVVQLGAITGGGDCSAGDSEEDEQAEQRFVLRHCVVLVTRERGCGRMESVTLTKATTIGYIYIHSFKLGKLRMNE